MEVAAYCHNCDRPLPNIIPTSGMCRGCEDAPFLARCLECGREFDLTDVDDADEWAYGHDCETA